MTKKTDKLLDSIINDKDTEEKVNSILAQAQDTGDVGEAYWKTLIYSGVALGVEKTQDNFFENTAKTVTLYKNSIAELDSATLLCNDLETIKQVQNVRKNFNDMLSGRARVLLAIYVKRVEHSLGIKEKYLAETLDIATVTDLEFQTIGFVAYTNVPSYLHAWNHFKEDKTLNTYTCKCAGCLLAGLLNKRVRPSDQIESIFETYGDSGKVFADFGRFVIESVRENLTNILDGTTHQPSYESDSAQTEVSDLMSFLKSRLD